MNTPDTGTSDRNISTEHQEEGDARRPADTLDREQAPGRRDRDAEDGRS